MAKCARPRHVFMNPPARYWLATLAVFAASATQAGAVHIQAPTSSTQDYASLALGFPALSTDRQRILIASTQSSGPQDVRSLVVSVWSPAGAAFRLNERIVIVADDEELRIPHALSLAQIASRIEPVNLRVQREGFRSMKAVLEENSTIVASLARGEQDSFELLAGRLKIRYARSGSTLSITKAPCHAIARHRFKPHKNPAEHCQYNASIPGGLWADDSDSIVVLKVMFLGSDTCTEPHDEWVVYRLK